RPRSPARSWRTATRPPVDSVDGVTVWVLVAEVGLTLWLGLYLLVREPDAAVSRRAGIGLLGYAAALATSLLAETGPGWPDRLLPRRRREHGAEPARDVDVLRRSLALIQDRLPPGSSMAINEDVGWRGPADRCAGRVGRAGPGKTVLVVEAKRSVVTRDLRGALERVQSAGRLLAGPGVPMLVATYLPPSARAWLEERGVSYADATGNLRVVLDRPALFLRDQGADHDPWRGPGRPRGTLQGPPCGPSRPCARGLHAASDRSGTCAPVRRIDGSDLPGSRVPRT